MLEETLVDETFELSIEIADIEVEMLSRGLIVSLIGSVSKESVEELLPIVFPDDNEGKRLEIFTPVTTFLNMLEVVRLEACFSLSDDSLSRASLWIILDRCSSVSQSSDESE